MTVTVEITQGLAAGKKFELRGETVTIGRRPDCDVVLEEAHVSAEHVRLEARGDRVIVRDFGSTNGTMVD